MRLPEIKDGEKYIGLYVVDFGDHAGVGFTAEEVAELLESEIYGDCQVYKVYNARPNGEMELRGVRRELFELEIGMFFYADDQETAKGDYDRLVGLAVKSAPPSRAKLHLSKYGERLVTALIYPAEYNDEMSRWLLDNEYKTSGAAEGGFEAVKRYYDSDVEILERHQLFGRFADISRTGDELYSGLKKVIQR